MTIRPINATKLKIKLMEQGITQKQIAEELGMLYQSFYSRLSGKTPMTLDESKKIKQILRLTDYEYIDIFGI